MPFISRNCITRWSESIDLGQKKTDVCLILITGLLVSEKMLFTRLKISIYISEKFGFSKIFEAHTVTIAECTNRRSYWYIVLLRNAKYFSSFSQLITGNLKFEIIYRMVTKSNIYENTNGKE